MSSSSHRITNHNPQILCLNGNTELKLIILYISWIVMASAPQFSPFIYTEFHHTFCCTVFSTLTSSYCSQQLAQFFMANLLTQLLISILTDTIYNYVEPNWDPPLIENWHSTPAFWSYLLIHRLLMRRSSISHYSSLVFLKSLTDKVHFDFWRTASLILADTSKELQLLNTGVS